MANSVVRAKIYNAILDEVLLEGLTSQSLEANPKNIKYDGGDSVLLAKMTMDGLQNYSRANGYTAKDVNLSWETYKIRQDRGVKFTIDAMDEDETMRTLTATNVIAAFAREKEIPEIDSYRYSSIFQAVKASSNVEIYALNKATVLSKLRDNIADVQDVIGDQAPLTVFISGQAFKDLNKSSELSKVMDVQGTQKANLRVYELDGVPLVVVPSARMKTDYVFGNGFAAATNHAQINWLVVSREAVTGFIKHQKVRTISADANQTADGEMVLARLYHDLWVMENKLDGMFANIGEANAPTFGATELAKTNATTITVTLGTKYTNRKEGHKFFFGSSVATTTAPKLYALIDTNSMDEIITASAAAQTVVSTYYGQLYEVDADGRVVQFGEVQAGT